MKTVAHKSDHSQLECMYFCQQNRKTHLLEIRFNWDCLKELCRMAYGFNDMFSYGQAASDSGP